MWKAAGSAILFLGGIALVFAMGYITGYVQRGLDAVKKPAQLREPNGRYAKK